MLLIVTLFARSMRKENSQCLLLPAKFFSSREVAMESLICSKCSKIFGYKRNLVCHEKICKGYLENKQKKGIKCPVGECAQVLSEYKLLRQHVESVHDVTFEEEHHHFNNLNDFKNWKERLEKQNVCMYVSRTSATTKHGKRTYYFCHRSGYFHSRSKGKRRIKSQGSNKIDSTCTSSMVVTETTDGIHVNYCATHFGHGSNLGRCRLTEDERLAIAGKNNFCNDIF